MLDYSSQPGGQYDGNGNDNDYTGVIDRHYSAIAFAIPTVKTASFLAKGLTAIKIDTPDPVLPGQVMTYFIAYSNTSAVYAANNVQIIDTYDPLLTYVTGNPPPSSHDPVTRQTYVECRHVWAQQRQRIPHGQLCRGDRHQSHGTHHHQHDHV